MEGGVSRRARVVCVCKGRRPLGGPGFEVTAPPYESGGRHGAGARSGTGSPPRHPEPSAAGPRGIPQHRALCSRLAVARGALVKIPPRPGGENRLRPARFEQEIPAGDMQGLVLLGKLSRPA